MEINGMVFLVCYWVIYFFLHSFLATTWMKEKINDLAPSLTKYYRLFYNTISIIGLTCILIYLAVVPSEFVFEKHKYVQFIGLVFATWGFVLLKLSFRKYSIREFLGLQQPNTLVVSHFCSTGILSKIRHPIYSGTILMVSGFFLFNPKVSMGVTLLCVIAYIAIGIQLEERKLIKEFGQQYLDYRQKVPMLLPRWESLFL